MFITMYHSPVPAITLFTSLLIADQFWLGSPSLSTRVRTDNQFASRLYKEASRATSSPRDNLFFSPQSITLAVDMIYSGARGDTARQICDVLGLRSSDGRALKSNEVNQDSKDLLTALGNPEGGMSTLTLGNGIFVRNGVGFYKQYLTAVKTNYNADMNTLDFARQPEKSRQIINKWVASRTLQKIDQLLPPGSITAYTSLMLVNAVYFKASWKTPFFVKFTKPRPFQIDDQHSLDVDMMFVNGRFRYGRLQAFKCTALELPYARDQFSMIILLPDIQSGYPDLLQYAVDFSVLPKLIAGLPYRYVDVHLPKFYLRIDLPLKSTLMRMGMTKLFSGTDADLSGISGRGLYISGALHQAQIDVDEAGTAATAVTGFQAGFVSLNPVFNASRPFVFAIIHQSTGLAIFVGRFMHPDNVDD